MSHTVRSTFDNEEQHAGGGSRKEFASKLGIVVEEADESIYGLELLEENGIFPAKKLKELLQKGHELTAIFTAARNTTRDNRLYRLHTALPAWLDSFHIPTK